MASSVEILFAMDTEKVSGTILKEAEEKYHKRAKDMFKSYLKKQSATLNNIILENLPSINGLPLSAFLSRMQGFTPLTRHGLSPVGKIIEQEVAKLMDTTQLSEDGTTSLKVSSHDKIQAIRTLCKLAVEPRDYEKMAEWLTHNAALLNEAVATSMSTDSRDLIQELCIGIAYLARKFRFSLYDKLELVIAALVRAMAIALIPWESYVEQFREAKEHHNDLELARGRQIIFHHPRIEYQFHEVNHRVLGCIYYTLGDLLFSCPSPKLIHFFECRIFRRKEMTRNLLFTILHVVVINLAEIQAEAERLVNLDRQPSSVSVPASRSMTPLMSRRGKIYSETLWHELPANLYSDIIRVYNDRNRANKILINEIMVMLRTHAPDKLPLFEEATLKALEMYTGAGGGRLTGTYPIGRPATARDGENTPTGTGASATQRRRKSLAGPDTTSGAGTEKTSEAVGRQRSSRITLMDTDQTDKTTENQSIESADYSSSEGNYTSDSTRHELRISRRTIIVPKIPELVLPNRGHRK
ncbi:uncharacterized protein DEA37_0001006 [Paragonimus westermani]|uniref:Uncharacterized protein n=1 Tax=Paragonimus westermani TaxID=34504 RepID=A0A5J4NW14_9TREM|nr:uncharacterized protein DEA37_0001006 [Paragonimus westermani]